jgi:hypothetical protein
LRKEWHEYGAFASRECRGLVALGETISPFHGVRQFNVAILKLKQRSAPGTVLGMRHGHMTYPPRAASNRIYGRRYVHAPPITARDLNQRGEDGWNTGKRLAERPVIFRRLARLREEDVVNERCRPRPRDLLHCFGVNAAGPWPLPDRRQADVIYGNDDDAIRRWWSAKTDDQIIKGRVKAGGCTAQQ